MDVAKYMDTGMDAKVAVKLINVAKFYGDRPIFKNISLELAHGQIALIAGANGAGKSTLMKLLAGLARPTSGEIRYSSDGPVAYLAHATFLYPGLTALENLTFWAKSVNAGLSRNELLALLKKMNLLAYAHRPARHFSRGMAQRLNFARVLLMDAKLYLLDEPFTGLDTESRQLMRGELLKLRGRGAAIALVSHDIATDSSFADQIFALAGGKLAYAGDIAGYNHNAQAESPC